MAFKFVVLCALVCLQGACCAPQVSLGTTMSDDFSKALAAAMGNIQNGVTAVSTPPIKVAFEGIPSFFNSVVHKATDTAAKFADAGQRAFGQTAVGAGNALGGGAQLGSAIAGGFLQTVGHGLNAANSAVGAAAKAGVDLTGKIADGLVGGTALSGNISGGILSAVGDGLKVAGGSANVLSNGMSTLLDAFSSRISARINGAEQAVASIMDTIANNIKNGTVNFSIAAQTNFYNLLKNFLTMLVNTQAMLNTISQSIAATASSGASAAAQAAAQAAGTAAGALTGGVTAGGSVSG